MATVTDTIGDVKVTLDYDISGEDVELNSVEVEGGIDIISILSKEQLAACESTCYWHNRNRAVDAEADAADYYRQQYLDQRAEELAHA